MRPINRPPSLCWSFLTIKAKHASSTEWPGKQAHQAPDPAASPEPCRYQPALQPPHAAAPVHPRSTHVRNPKHHARLQTDKARHPVPALLTTPSPHDLQALAPGPKSIHSVILHCSTSWHNQAKAPNFKLGLPVSSAKYPTLQLKQALAPVIQPGPMHSFAMHSRQRLRPNMALKCSLD